jgi:hypothetical protein
MSTARLASPGKSRTCPHCRATILDSAKICPACKGHLRFGESSGARAVPSFSALHVEGTINHRADDPAWEYAVVVTVRNQRGEEVTRQVVGIGALSAQESRTFELNVEVFAPKG